MSCVVGWFKCASVREHNGRQTPGRRVGENDTFRKCSHQTVFVKKWHWQEGNLIAPPKGLRGCRQSNGQRDSNAFFLVSSSLHEYNHNSCLQTYHERVFQFSYSQHSFDCNHYLVRVRTHFVLLILMECSVQFDGIV